LGRHYDIAKGSGACEVVNEPSCGSFAFKEIHRSHGRRDWGRGERTNSCGFVRSYNGPGSSFIRTKGPKTRVHSFIRWGDDTNTTKQEDHGKEAGQILCIDYSIYNLFLHVPILLLATMVSTNSKISPEGQSLGSS